MKDVSKKEVTTGLIIGLSIGLPAIIVALLLARPWAATPATPSPTATKIVIATTQTILTPTPSPQVAVSSTDVPTVEAVTTPVVDASTPVTHEVAAGEVLGTIAELYGISQEALEEANDIENPDLIWEGQVLVIPLQGIAAPATAEPVEPVRTDPITTTPEVAPTNALDVDVLSADYPAQLSGNLTAAYPAEETTPRFTVHYAPGTYVETDLDNVVAMLTRGLRHIETQLDAEISGGFDVYVAGSLFASPNLALRGRSFSANRHYFFLHDSTGNDADQQYIATHEMTHLFAWNVFGRPVSAMLSEGVAVYTGITAIADSDHLPVREFCGAYHRAGRLPRVTSGLRFEGHIRDLENYYAAGCFVQYLIETYGAAKFGELYPTGNYTAAYDQTLGELEAGWIEDLEASGAGSGLDPEALFAISDAVAVAYDRLFAGFSATENEWLAYAEIDAGRIALLEGRFEDAETHLTAAERLLAEM